MNILNITEEAKQYILDLCEEKKAGKKAVGLSVEAVKGGCSGLQFKFNLEYEILNEECIKISEEVFFYIKKTSLLFVVGSTLTYKKTDTSAMLLFENTKVSKQCGCGKSFI